MLSVLWLVARRWSGFAVLVDPRTVYTGPGMSLTRIRPLVSLPWASGYWGPNTSSLLSSSCFRSP